MSWAIANHIDRGLAADRPAGISIPGKHYGWFATDTGVLSIWDGSAWIEIGPGSGAVDSVFGRTGAVAAATSDYDASQVDFTPAGTIAATDVQAAIEEVAAEASGDVAAATHAASSKGTPVDADEIPLADSAASFALKKLTWANLKATIKAYTDTLYPSGSGVSSGTNTGDQTSVSGNAGTATALQTSRNIDGQAFDGTADITVIAPGTHAASSKTTPADADEFPLVDSAASNVLKKLTGTNLKAYLKAYFDTIYSGAATSRKTYLSKPAGNITRAATSVGAFSTAWQITGVVVASGQNVRLKMQASCSGPNNDRNFTFYRDSTALAAATWGIVAGNNAQPCQLEWIDENPGAGTYTYEVRAAQFVSGTLTVFQTLPTTDVGGGGSIFIAEVYTP